MKIRLLVALLILSCGISCTSNPIEPTKVAREYIDAMASNNCLKQAKYWIPVIRDEFGTTCMQKKSCELVQYRIDAVEESDADRNSITNHHGRSRYMVISSATVMK